MLQSSALTSRKNKTKQNDNEVNMNRVFAVCHREIASYFPKSNGLRVSPFCAGVTRTPEIRRVTRKRHVFLTVLKTGSLTLRLLKVQYQLRVTLCLQDARVGVSSGNEELRPCPSMVKGRKGNHFDGDFNPIYHAEALLV